MSAPTSTKSKKPAWDQEDLSGNVHAAADKDRRVQQMFSAIARSYDLNNRLHSLWRDQAWRRQAVKLCRIRPEDSILDVACGTGDLALALGRALSRSASAQAQATGSVMGLDFTEAMLRIASDKAAGQPVTWAAGDAMRLPLADASQDVVTIAFGIRNVSDPARAIGEFHRVMRPGGRLCILEFSLPTSRILRGLYNFYFHHVMPRTATLISRDRSGAYRYLPKSVNTFLGREQMRQMMEEAGFKSVRQHPMTFGIAVAYVGLRR
ncbi:MAG: bifunctional demethylmenaquinone methyltransferase/2-methoxy-6-polyprenyl-1,4-benzoquinol methylase UbiE [Phycisphaeraceae bacterium]|nr:bifunctional demethylmenaquinone methyltransferase/2-methoxy-6-polyprenyl-1,4-benzoquinol methylase UbiE [Phycisphaeraceae bacterium]